MMNEDKAIKEEVLWMQKAKLLCTKRRLVERFLEMENIEPKDARSLSCDIILTAFSTVESLDDIECMDKWLHALTKQAATEYWEEKKIERPSTNEVSYYDNMDLEP